MKLRPITNIDRRDKAMSKKFENYVMAANCDVIVIFPIDGQFRAIRKPHSHWRVCKTYIFIKKNPLFYKK